MKLYYYLRGPPDFKRKVRRIIHSSKGWSKHYKFKETKRSYQLGKHGNNVYFSIELVPKLQMQEKFPSLVNERMNLSVCDMDAHKIYINEDRWMNGSVESKLQLKDYRTYVINHEIGHILGKGHRVTCTVDGYTPVMMQQTRGTYNCTPNPYPSESDFRGTRY